MDEDVGRGTIGVEFGDGSDTIEIGYGDDICH